MLSMSDSSMRNAPYTRSESEIANRNLGITRTVRLREITSYTILGTDFYRLHIHVAY